jgi:predicted proteasome-type protease
METSIIVALLTGGFAIIVAVINKFKSQNHDDHESVMSELRQVHREVERVGDKVDRHIEWHGQGISGDGAARRDRE